jgi:hypothetical protein
LINENKGNAVGDAVYERTFDDFHSAGKGDYYFIWPPHAQTSYLTRTNVL